MEHFHMFELRIPLEDHVFYESLSDFQFIAPLKSEIEQDFILENVRDIWVSWDSENPKQLSQHEIPSH